MCIRGRQWVVKLIESNWQHKVFDTFVKQKFIITSIVELFGEFRYRHSKFLILCLLFLIK